jgi:sugar phosphate isomerase/epimerase
MKKVRAMGYHAVQASAMGPIPEAELVEILQGEGLTCCATHEPGQMILDEPERITERLQKLNCRFTAYPYPAGVDMSDEAQVRELARKLDKAGATLKKAGQVLTYHNHAIEWLRLGNRLAIEIIYDETNSENVQGELDTYWVQYGGGDPADWCRRLRGRLPLLHLKDYAFTKENQPVMAEIGNGNLNFREIVQAAEASGCEWFIVEQDVCPGDPFDSLKMSFDYIASNLVS